MPSQSDRFGRAYRLDIGDKRLESGIVALKIGFSIERSTTRFPNKCQIQVWNLSPDSIRSLQARQGLSVRLEAGYVNDMRQLFFGELRRVSSVKTRTEIVTTLFGGDATTPLTTATISRSFPKGTAISDVLGALVKALGVGTGNLAAISGILAGRKLAAPLTISGPVSEELEDFTRSFGLQWSIQDGAFTIVRVGDPLPATQGPLIDAAHGLIESPTVDPKTKHVSGKTFLDARLRPGIPFEVHSMFVNGKYVAVKTKDSGEWDAQDWCTEFEGKPIGAVA